jgi:hypothetical protein
MQKDQDRIGSIHAAKPDRLSNAADHSSFHRSDAAWDDPTISVRERAGMNATRSDK